MRWHTASYGSASEAAERQEALRRIDAWWSAFVATATTIDELFRVPDSHPDFDLVEWMDQHLGKVDPRLMWEYGPAVAGKTHRLVITPEAARSLRPLTDEILKRAPDCAFEFYGARLPESFEEGIEAAASRTGLPFLLTGIDCALGSGHRIDLSATVDASASEDELDIAMAQAIILCSIVVGEALTDRWLGYVDVVASRAAGSGLETLAQRFESRIDECRTARQAQRYAEIAADSQWSLLELQPDPDREITPRSDLFVHRTMDLEFFETAHRRIPFDSERFSSHGERFCYLMLDGRNADMEGFRDKSEIEDALDAALRPGSLGAVVGSGTGTRYSYIDLAIGDVDAACRTIIDVLRAGGIVRNAWILFHDDEWHDEWIGIYDDTPPPIARDVAR